MGEYTKKVLSQIFNFIRGMSLAKKLGMFATILLMMVIMVYLFNWAGTTNYVPMMTNLSPEDSSNIIRILREKRIPFQVDTNGKDISIPQESIYDFRLELATMGLPQSSVVGYEIFDKQNLGTTTFIQKVNHRRAQEGELIRTINSIKGVRRSRVHLALPQRSTFIEDQKRATASVVVDLEPGTVLSEKQVYGIGNLVARGVEGLEITDVVIMNADGKVLSKNPTDPLSAATASQLDYQEKLEADLEKRIETMMARVVGDGHVVARVTVDLDFSQVNEVQTNYDADGSAVLSVEKHNDSMNGVRPAPGGVAGAAANTPGLPPTSGGGGGSEIKTETLKNNEVTNYKVPETIKRTSRPIGGIRRLSVAVVIDGHTVKTKSKEGVETSQIEAWAPEKMTEFEQIVAQAVGLDKKRGDTIEIKNMEFTHEDFEEAQRVLLEKENKVHIENLALYGIIGLAILMFFVFAVRPFIKWITENTIDNVDTYLPQTIEELEKLQRNSNLPVLEESVPTLPDSMDPSKIEGEMIKEKIITLVDANPHKAALILKEWLHNQKTVPKPDEASGAKTKAANA